MMLVSRNGPRIVIAQDSEWEEDKHKRADNGQFGSGGGGAAPAAKSGSSETKMSAATAAATFPKHRDTLANLKDGESTKIKTGNETHTITKQGGEFHAERASGPVVKGGKIPPAGQGDPHKESALKKAKEYEDARKADNDKHATTAVKGGSMEVGPGGKKMFIPGNTNEAERSAVLGPVVKGNAGNVKSLMKEEDALKRDMDLKLKSARNEGEKASITQKYEAEMRQLQESRLDRKPDSMAKSQGGTVVKGAAKEPVHHTKMSATQLEKTTEKADKAHMALVDKMIAAGRGHEKPSETRTKDDALSKEFNASMERVGELSQERQARLTYHGKLHPIKRAGDAA